jgi:hypothetical protein
MQTNQYEFRGNYAYKNGKRLIRKWDLLCEVESLASENYRLVWGNNVPNYHYDHLTCAELVAELKYEISRHNELTKN